MTTPNGTGVELTGNAGILLGKIIEGQDRMKDDILRMQEKSEAGRRDLHEKVNDISSSVQSIDQRMTNIERSFAKAEPDLIEFRAIKERARGMSIAGRWMWAAGGALVSIGVWIISHVMNK